MTLWLILGAITLAVLAALLVPLLRKPCKTERRVDYDMIVYRDQLAEVGKDIERGLITSEQADTVRAEIYRRMLAVEDAEVASLTDGLEKKTSRLSKLLLFLTILIGVPLGAGLLYLYLGSPELAGKPYAERKNDSDFAMLSEAEALAAQLENNPDADGYKHLADTYFMLRRYDQASEVYHKIIDLNGGNANIWSELGESIVLSHSGMVIPEAHTAFAKALQFDCHEARARFYLGLAETQINELRRAVAIWRDLEKDSPADAPWLPMLKEHITSFSKEGGFAPESVPPMPPLTTSPHVMEGTTVDQPTPTMNPSFVNSDAATAVMAMPASDQQDAIHKMVDRLAAKMKANPNDLEGWKRLARSYHVLGETDKAEDAESKAAALEAKAAPPQK